MKTVTCQWGSSMTTMTLNFMIQKEGLLTFRTKTWKSLQNFFLASTTQLAVTGMQTPSAALALPLVQASMVVGDDSELQIIELPLILALLTRTWASVAGGLPNGSIHSRVSIRPQHEFYAVPFAAANDFFEPLDGGAAARWLRLLAEESKGPWPTVLYWPLRCHQGPEMIATARGPLEGPSPVLYSRLLSEIAAPNSAAGRSLARTPGPSYANSNLLSRD